MKNKEGCYKHIISLFNHPTLLAVILTALCWYCLNEMKAEYQGVIRIVLLFVCYISSMLITESRDFDFFKLSKLAKITIVLICVWLSFSISGTRFLDNVNINIGKSAFFFLINSIWIFPVSNATYVYATDIVYKNKKGTEEKRLLSIRDRLLMTAIIVALGILVVIAFNPAITSLDSEHCYSEAYNIILGKPITDSHPFFYKFLISIPMRINRSISFVIICQILFYATIFVKGVNFLSELGLSIKACWIVFLLGGIAYNSIIQLGTLWKDIPYSISLLWLSILLAQFTVKRKTGLTTSWYIEFAISCILVIFVRHGGIIPALLSIILVALLTKEKKKILICLTSILILALLIRVPLFKSLHVIDDTSKGMKYTGLTADIQYVYHYGGHLNQDAIHLVELAEKDGHNYTPFCEYNNYWNLSDVKMSDFLAIYINTFVKNPVLMTKGILVRNNNLWTIVKPEKALWNCVARTTESHIMQDASISIPMRKENFLTRLLSGINDWLIQFPLVFTLYWRVGLYVTLSVTSTLIIVSVQGKKAFSFLLPFVPIVTNCLVLVASCPWVDYRYFWPTFVVSCFLLPYGLSGMQVTEEKSNHVKKPNNEPIPQNKLIDET